SRLSRDALSRGAVSARRNHCHLPRPVRMTPQPSADGRSALEALSDIAAAINSVQEPEALLETVLEIAMQTLDAERGFILLEEAGGGRPFEVKTSRNFTDEQLSGMAQLSTSVVGEVLRSGEPVLIYEAATDARYREAESVVLQKIQS